MAVPVYCALEPRKQGNVLTLCRRLYGLGKGTRMTLCRYAVDPSVAQFLHNPTVGRERPKAALCTSSVQALLSFNV